MAGMSATIQVWTNIFFASLEGDRHRRAYAGHGHMMHEALSRHSMRSMALQVMAVYRLALTDLFSPAFFLSLPLVSIHSLSLSLSLSLTHTHTFTRMDLEFEFYSTAVVGGATNPLYHAKLFFTARCRSRESGGHCTGYECDSE